MKYVSISILVLAAASGAFAQGGGDVLYQTSGRAVSISSFQKGPAAPVTGAPYSATISNDTTQTLEDGSHIVQTMNGNVARDSQGRTRQDAPLPAIGNLSATNAPHLVFIQDPVAQVSYTLDLTDKTAQKMAIPSSPSSSAMVSGTAGAETAGPVFMMSLQNGQTTAAAGTMPPPLPAPNASIMMQKAIMIDDSAQVSTEDLGSETMQGVTVTGTRTTRTIPVGQIGNDAPISIVTEVWMSPELKTVVYSKRSDPRMGVQTFQLTNITRGEPDPSLFTVPTGFSITDGPRPIFYRTSQQP
jgi:hypothetical protein